MANNYYCKILCYDNGMRRCARCDQVLTPDQKECPSCHALFNGIERVQGNGFRNESPFTSANSSRAHNNAHGKPILKILIGLVGICATIFIIKTITQNNESFNIRGYSPTKHNSRHTESPSGQTDTETNGFSYRITQLFFLAESSDATKNAITQYLSDNNIQYENLYYTTEGYYTCDLTGYTSTSKENYNQQQQELSEGFNSWCEKQKSNFGIVQMTVQGSYMSYGSGYSHIGKTDHKTPTASPTSAPANSEEKTYSDDRVPNLNSLKIDPSRKKELVYDVISYTGLFSYSVHSSYYTDVYDYYHSLNRYYDPNDYNHYIFDEYNQKVVQSLADTFNDWKDKNSYTDSDIVRELICFVQSIIYEDDEASAGKIEWPKYPIETLYEQSGDCEDTSILLAAFLRAKGYGCVLFKFPNHVAVGIKGSDSMDGAYREYNGSRYFYVETTAKGWKIGQIPEGYNISDAEIIEIR